MGYKIEDDYDDIEYDLSKAGGPVGITPEPSQDMVLEWQTAMNEGAVAAQLDLPPDATPIDAAKALLAKDRVRLSEQSLVAFAKLCGAVEKPNPSKAKGAPPTILKGGSPSYDELKALPFRAQRGFFGYITGLLMNPESRPAATSD